MSKGKTAKKSSNAKRATPNAGRSTRRIQQARKSAANPTPAAAAKPKKGEVARSTLSPSRATDTITVGQVVMITDQLSTRFAMAGEVTKIEARESFGGFSKVYVRMPNGYIATTFLDGIRAAEMGEILTFQEQKAKEAANDTAAEACPGKPHYLPSSPAQDRQRSVRNMRIVGCVVAVAIVIGLLVW